ncbi:hypothetical protein [Beijerinckia sp. L45]|uniref:hypothetical protein n=1 Tax=Beijerinckia sp. L45 TaxID=1641855 RepID=UPI001AEE2704|nr:hypothetical protein [Beijerinckia sp. L45]
MEGSAMSLARAFKLHAAQVNNVQAAYKANVIAVNTLMNTVLSSSLPTLTTPPPDWDSYSTAYMQAKSDALGWVNNVLNRLLSVPGDVQGYNSIITTLLQDALRQAQALVINPNNDIALQILRNDLSTVSQQLSSVSVFVQGTVSQLQSFGNSLPDMATQLQSIATMSSQDANADQQQIDALNTAISQLQSDIKSLTAAIVALAIADGIALTLGVVATIAAWPVGALTWLVMGPVVAVATYEITMDGIQITSDKNEITAKENAMNNLTADVATLQVLATTYGNLATDTTAIEKSLNDILVEWQALESDVTAAVNDIVEATSDTSGTNYAAVVNDLQDAVTQWNASYTQAGALTIQINVNNAQLGIGMTQAQVSATLASGKVTDVITYFNSITVGNQQAQRSSRTG